LKVWTSLGFNSRCIAGSLLLLCLPIFAKDDEKVIEELLNKVIKEGTPTHPHQQIPKSSKHPVQKLSNIQHYRHLSQKLLKMGKLTQQDLKYCETYSKQFFHTDQGLNKLFRYHTVQTGEYLSSIARKYHITASRISEFNPDLDPNRIFPGQKIKIVAGPNSVLVCKSDYQMYLFIQGVLFEHYTIGIGREGKSTPLLKTKLSDSRAKFPSYTHPETKITYPFGHPENPIGTRWMGFEGYQGYGIHGTDDETSIGKAMSSGCIRMKQLDLEHVYNLLFIGDDVEIIP
jgi:lipoprotein-anchoring transpeptidase ErfK/SrfK